VERVDVFRTVNSNDIQFIASAVQRGLLSTRRQYSPAGIRRCDRRKEGDFTWRVAYSFVGANLPVEFEVNAESNSTADANGNILVTPGDRIPLVPRSTCATRTRL